MFSERKKNEYYLPFFACIIGANEIFFVAQMKDFFGANEMPIGAKAKHRKIYADAKGVIKHKSKYTISTVVSILIKWLNNRSSYISVERESKAITGKSLRNLSKYVPEGLTLAVHLDLPDSTITGIGFDAISNGLSMADVTYKILLYWKRTRKDKKDIAVEMLADALREMGRVEAAHVVQECHKNSKEVTPEIYSELLSKMALSWRNIC